ncbi:hypothetical protein ACTMSW_08430 [Micromonospora sp. BQ11]|uniref:hypothetical protein n=1 Tax=Micromonospora sp. BQ11 TaxID=3452212 RepID=UPI003F88CE1C
MTKDGPGYTPQDLLRPLSLPRRVAHLVAGLGGLTMAVLISVLWATEPRALPVGTRVAFSGMIVVGLCWAGVAGWALGRRPLFAADRVVAAGLALTASVLVTLATVAITLARDSVRGLSAAVALGLALTGTAGVALARARSHRAALLSRRWDLEKRPDGDLPPARPEGRDRSLLPVGPLALALRHFSTPGRAAVMAAVLAAGVVAGTILLSR